MTVTGALLSRVHRVLQIVHAMLREIFDESAYSRFLRRRDLTPSRDSYAQFLQESETARAQRVRCC